MTGVRREWVAGSNFVMLHLDLVDALGGSYEAAALLNRIQFRGGDDGWVATKDDMMADIRLSEWKLDRAVRELRNAGFIETERVSAFDPTLRWRVVFADHGTVTEESSPTRTGDPRSTTSVKEESSVTVKEESSVTSSLEEQEEPVVEVGSSQGRPTGARVDNIEAETHDRQSMTVTWTPRPHFGRWLRHKYDFSATDLDLALTRFRAYQIDNNRYSRSWENTFEAWVAEDFRRRQAAIDSDATDSMGAPLNQRKTSRYDDTRTPEEIEAEMEELHRLAVETADRSSVNDD